MEGGTAAKWTGVCAALLAFALTFWESAHWRFTTFPLSVLWVFVCAPLVGIGALSTRWGVAARKGAVGLTLVSTCLHLCVSANPFVATEPGRLDRVDEPELIASIALGSLLCLIFLFCFVYVDRDVPDRHNTAP